MEEKKIVLVIGNNADNIMSNFKKKEVEPFIKYYFKDAARLKEMELSYLKEINNKYGGLYSQIIEEINNLQDEDYFYFFTRNLNHDNDGNAISTENINGKWKSYKNTNDNYNFILKNGTRANCSQKKNINWSLLHLNEEKTNIYSVTWDLYNNAKKPLNDTEIQIYKNMHNKTAYFNEFNNKDEYIKYNTSFWVNSVIYKLEWIDMDDFNYKNWILNFYDTFISRLDNNELLTLFEYDK